MSNKTADLQKILAQIQKKNGENALWLGNKNGQLDVTWIPSGLISFDLATRPHMGPGGIPRGRLIELFGPEGSGKTTIALSAIAEEQKLGGQCAFFDSENAFNPYFAEMLGVDVEALTFSQENEGEMSIDMVEALVRSNAYTLIVIDSVAALAPIDELQSDMSQQHMALAPRMWSKAMRKLKGALKKHNCTLILINQLREKVGVMYGNPETTPGGRAIKFFADMRIDVRKREEFSIGTGDDKDVIGHRLRARIVKNKVGKIYGKALLDLYYDTGFDKTQDIINAGEEKDVILKSGGWRTYIPLGKEDDEQYHIKGNGVEQFINKLNKVENPELMLKEIKERILLGRTEPLYYKTEELKEIKETA